MNYTSFIRRQQIGAEVVGAPEKRLVMGEIKIIFFDIDGTLVDPATGRISQRTCHALRQLHRNGILVCIATGRPTASLPDFGDLPIDAICAFNGSLCFAGNSILYSNPIPPKDVETVLQNASMAGRPVSIAGRNRLAANGSDTDLADYYRLAGVELTVAEDFDSVCREPVYQIMIGGRTAEEAAFVEGTSAVKLTRSWDRAVDVIPATSGKGVGIEKIIGHFHLEASQALAFGDSYNDTEMLLTVGTGVAMGNAPEEIKALAADRCGPVGEDGIYHYCLEHGLIQ